MIMATKKTKLKTKKLKTTETSKVVVPRIDVDTPDDTVSSAVMARLEAGPAGKRPDITHLPDALDVDGRPLFTTGDKILIERYASMLSTNPWLDTHTYTVHAIDDRTGGMRLWDETVGHWALDNYLQGPRVGQVYKMATERIDGKKKRKRGEKKTKKTEVLAPTPKADGQKRRGRPKGAKNRPRDVVEAEREVKRLQKALKAQKRGVRS